MNATAIADARLRSERPTVVQTQHTGEVVCALGGEFDMGSADVLSDALDRAVAVGEPRLVVDLTDTVFMDSSALNLLLEARTRLAAEGRWLMTRNAQRPVARLLDLVRRRHGIVL